MDRDEPNIIGGYARGEWVMLGTNRETGQPQVITSPSWDMHRPERRVALLQAWIDALKQQQAAIGEMLDDGE